MSIDFDPILRKFFSYETRHEISEFFASMPTWATLRTLGQSKLLALTVVTPFLGHLILFNDQLVELFSLSPKIVARWLGESAQEAQIATKSITFNRLQVVYFGLVFLGAASALFKILCPKEMKEYESISEYIEGEKPLIARARVGILTIEISRDYLRNHGEEEMRGPKYLRRIACPLSDQILFHSVIEEITETSEAEAAASQESDASSSDQNDDQGIDLDPYGVRVGPRNVVDSEKVARIVYNQRSVERGFWLNFQSTSNNYLTDLLALRYNALNRSIPSSRIIISLMYALGFVILLMPTLQTFALVVSQFFR